MDLYWIFRIVVAGNLFVLVYLALYPISTTSPTSSTSNYASNNTGDLPVPSAIRVSSLPLQASPSDVAGGGVGGPPLSGESLEPAKPLPESVKGSNEGGGVGEEESNLVGDPAPLAGDPVVADDTKTGGEEGGAGLVKTINGEIDFDSNLNDGMSEPLINESRQLDLAGLNVLKSQSDNKIFPCDDYTPRRYYGQRGKYWVLYNYFKATKTFRCDQSITYATHSDWTFLDNLLPLLERWQGPISITLYSPGTDFDESLERIQYLRECTSTTIVKDLVTFHLFFDQSQVPSQKVPSNPDQLPVNCTLLANTVTFGEGIQTFKQRMNLSYPVNVGRNVAREMATTHYVFPSDIELYPNPNLIRDFLEMIRRNDTVLQRPAPKVFVLPIFELEANVTALPYDKRDLIYMLINKSAIPFHKYICPECHRIPKAARWLKAPFQPGLKVFHIGKRHRPYHRWEPIFIGTKFDPMYDERLSWEGRSDKMTQGYVLCVLDYEFHILNNAFLIHRPGIKTMKISPNKNPAVVEQNAVISKIIRPELKQIYGTRPGCEK